MKTFPIELLRYLMISLGQTGPAGLDGKFKRQKVIRAFEINCLLHFLGLPGTLFNRVIHRIY
jgi:hypothetical protein